MNNIAIVEFDFNNGDQLILQLLANQIIEGTYIDGGKDHVVLINVASSASNSTVKGPHIYYRPEMAAILLVRDDIQNRNIRELTRLRNLNPKLLLIDFFEYGRLKYLTREFTYLCSLDARYYKAMENMKHYETLGLSILTTSLEKYTLLSLICFATWDHVYIFDFLCYNKAVFPAELKEVLESKNIVKIMHESRLFTEILRIRFKITMKNVFDTKVADIKLRKEAGENPVTTRTLQECLTHYVNLPPMLLEPEEYPMSIWKKRPITPERKYNAAQKVTYLITLMQFMKDKMLLELYNSVDDFVDDTLHGCLYEYDTKVTDDNVYDFLNNLTLK